TTSRFSWTWATRSSPPSTSLSEVDSDGPSEAVAGLVGGTGLLHRRGHTVGATAGDRRAGADHRQVRVLTRVVQGVGEDPTVAHDDQALGAAADLVLVGDHHDRATGRGQ